MNLEGARVLVVDDSVDLADNLREILESEGAAVEVAHTGREARAAFDQTLDLALIDVRLPDATGLALLRELKDASTRPFEGLLITGNASLEDAIEAVEAGAYAYVLKPFVPAQLLANVARALDKVRLEGEAELLARALERREANLRTLVETVQALLLVLDEQGRVLEANPAVCDTVGRTRDAVLRTTFIEEFILRGDHPAATDALRGALEGNSVNFESRVLRTGGAPLRTRTVQWSFAGVTLETGERRVFASGLDVTDVREFQRRARLAEKLAAVGTLSAGLAHEIRNPLNGAGLQLELLERRVTRQYPEADTDAVVDSVKTEISRLSRLVDDFLEFARPKGLRLSSVNLVEVVERVITLERPAAEASGTALRHPTSGARVEVEADAEKILQVLLNLVRNACEAVSGTSGTVTVTVRGDGEGALVEVRDNGPGIPAEDAERVFEPFFSTKDKGTGLGMAICHSLVMRHGGSIGVRNEGGAVFEVRLPKRPPDQLAAL